MQDRFRFRFWNEKAQKWFHFGFETYSTYEEQIWGALADGKKIYQSTGLKDKNGKLIYEGDIVKDLTYSGNVKYVCAFVPIFGGLGLISGQDLKDYNFCKENWKSYTTNTKVRNLDNRFKLANQGNKLYCFSMVELRITNFEILGNIYENPELLKKVSKDD